MKFFGRVKRNIENERLRQLLDRLKVPAKSIDITWAELIIGALNSRAGDNERVRSRFEAIQVEYNHNVSSVRTEYEEGVQFVLTELQHALDNPDS